MLHSRAVLVFLWVLVICACARPEFVLKSPAVESSPPAAQTASSGQASNSASPPPLAVAGDVQQVAAFSSFPVFTDPGELPRLKVAGDGGKELPLEHTHVKARLTGFVAEVEISQTYQNPSSAPIEAQYIFPLPENSAVFHMRMVIGERVVEAIIKERQQARQIYEEAKRQGYTAALLEQERPNIFTQSVANIEPGKKIDVVVRYVQDLTYDAGQYEFVFPMVVGPRYIQGAALEGPQSGSGTYQDTTLVPDASRITPPVLGKGERSGHDISLELTASASMAIGDFSVPTHEVISRRPADGSLHVTLAEKKALPNRDFVLRYRVAGEKPKATLLTSGGSEGFFSLVIHPPAVDVDDLVGRREIIFVVDVSGSMSGVPLALCKAAMREAIRQLRPVDTFNLITFSGSTGKAFERPRPANIVSIREALSYVDRMRAGGGTHLLDAVGEALSGDVEKGRHRYVFFLTDGYVGMEDRILAATRDFVQSLEQKGQRAKVFGFGVGSSPNRHLLDGLSRAGKGLAVYASNREDPARAVNQFYRYIDRSVLRDVKIDWGGLNIMEIMPQEIPDLFASRPLIVHGRYRGTSSKPVVVRATYANGALDIPVTADTGPADGTREVLGMLWARSKVDWLEIGLWDKATKETSRSEITKLGLDFHLVTRFTSLVAVDLSKKVGDGNPTKIMQPVEVPEDVDADMAGARSYQARARVLSERGALQDLPPDSAAEPEATPVVDMGASAPSEQAMAPPRGPRGCNCRLTEESPSGRWAFLATGIVLAALCARRTLVQRRRKCTKLAP